MDRIYTCVLTQEVEAASTEYYLLNGKLFIDEGTFLTSYFRLNDSHWVCWIGIQLRIMAVRVRKCVAELRFSVLHTVGMSGSSLFIESITLLYTDDIAHNIYIDFTVQ